MATESSSWTLDELHRLPDDGNKYELVHGELFVTPPPARQHETIAARLARVLDPYVQRHGLGLVYRPRAVLRTTDGEVEPDLMVRDDDRGVGNARETAPIPILVVEIVSPPTRRRDLQHKKQFYMDTGVGAYWVIDPETQTVRVSRPGDSDTKHDAMLRWHPAGAVEAFTLDVPDLFVGLHRSG